MNNLANTMINLISLKTVPVFNRNKSVISFFKKLAMSIFGGKYSYAFIRNFQSVIYFECNKQKYNWMQTPCNRRHHWNGIGIKRQADNVTQVIAEELCCKQVTNKHTSPHCTVQYNTVIEKLYNPSLFLLSSSS